MQDSSNEDGDEPGPGTSSTSQDASLPAISGRVLEVCTGVTSHHAMSFSLHKLCSPRPKPGPPQASLPPCLHQHGLPWRYVACIDSDHAIAV